MKCEKCGAEATEFDEPETSPFAVCSSSGCGEVFSIELGNLEVPQMQIELDILKKHIGTGARFGCSATQRTLKCGYRHAAALLQYAVDSGQARQCENGYWIEFV